MGTTIGVIGVGSMGGALIRGWLRSSSADLSLVLFDVVDEVTRGFADQSRVVSSLKDVALAADIVVVVVKPKDTASVFEELAQNLRADQIVVSAAACVALDDIRAGVGAKPSVFRLMPNLGVELGEGVLALATEPSTSDDATERVTRALDCLGVVRVLPEDMFDAVTAASGSSIAFLAIALEGMEDGAVNMGMPRPIARAFVRQTAVASALLLQRYPGSAADIKDQVSSPGGTTIAGLGALEDGKVRATFMHAIEEATKRSREMRDAGKTRG
jgi:pyrroline-5-carboxylate reductase